MKRTLLSAAMLLMVVSAWAQKTTLALNLKKGTTYYQNTVSNVSIDQNLGGQTMTIEMSITGKMAFLVKEASATEYTMDVSYASLGMEVKGPTGTMAFSSDKKDESDVMSSIMGEMVGKTFTVVMLKNGKVKEVKDVDKLYSTIFDKHTDLPEMSRQQIKAQLSQAYGEKAFKGNIEMTTAFYPEKPVAKGEKWQSTSKIESTMVLDLNSTFEYLEHGKGYHAIRGEGKLTTADAEKFVESNGLQMRYDLNGTMTSDIKIDDQSGWVIEAVMKQDMSGSAHIKPGPQIPDGMEVPMQMTSETKISQ